MENIDKEKQWILANDKMPIPSDGFGMWYIVCDDHGQVFPLRYVFKNVRGKRVERWEWYFGNIYYGNIVAWMPFPEPYKK